MHDMNTDRFALKGEIRARQAACGAISTEIRLTKKKLDKLHHRLIKKYKEEHEGSRKGWKDFRDQHATYQSIKAEIRFLRNAKEKHRTPAALYLANAYLRGKTYGEIPWGGYGCEQETAQWIPGADADTLACIRMWIQKSNLTRRDIEVFGLEAARVQEAERSLSEARGTLDSLSRKSRDQEGKASEARQWADRRITEADAAKAAFAATRKEYQEQQTRIKECEEALKAARDAFQEKRASTLKEVAA